ncbi:MAG: hypothetical protein GXC73_15435 [Chitinophagaceae bacterium]|jgi:hypothetical protein|nr:hypothetical protein [Chitinophagaceae bacterium]
MKKSMKNAVIGLLTLVAVTTGFTTFANDTKEITPSAELKMIGRWDNQPIFQLKLNNAQAEKFVIVVKDEFGVILHQETITGVNVTRKYQLNTEDLEGVDVTVEVTSTKATQPVVFSIKNNTRVVSETAIVKL